MDRRSKAANEPWTATQSQPPFPQISGFYWGNTDSLLSLSLSPTSTQSVCVCVHLGEWVRERDRALLCDLEMKGEVETRGMQPNDLQ